ncbi:adenylate/guanylate cyclase domain-containing protein [Mycolicibacterium pallens]|uniref:Adenylate/guanylate cyclase domain-containing protein n=1 Tax=Mycolicibacterium pallens TaxID=370524 RepID=A0ABX8VBF8_9MYCO|nr:adenylate/guanylate cyclase domain-containing protein [Mycolicibacterium pallens]APE14411.1 adenylate/guanylate cyclase domain-containing protein [Mycobacterium sp. WY10]QYL15122.1 adenylate/guanylate cyclase domain-containing protein [Mycolicibacterium pallens]
MDRIWQSAWERYGAWYSWVIWVVVFAVLLPSCLVWSWVVVAFEKSSQYVEATVITGVAVAVFTFFMVLPGSRRLRGVEEWAAGREVDRVRALEDTYTWTRSAVVRWLVLDAVGTALLLILVAAVTGASESRLIQYGILGAAFGFVATVFGMHSLVEPALRPPRAALVGDTQIGDSLPRTHPTFAAWVNLSMLAAAFNFALSAAMLAVVFDPVRDVPVLCVVIAFALVLFYAVPFTIFTGFAPSLRPVRDLTEGTERVAAGIYTRRLPVVQDDDLGALAASFNRMQAGLVERQRLQAAFGTYVDPALAARLLEQGDDVFTGERREVTVMFIDVRDFTPFAEANTAEDTVARLNALFEIVVPAVIDAGGHVNKFLGDGALAVFGAPNDLADHADAAVRAAVSIQRMVTERFSGELRIGIGINTGVVIAGTIGAAGHLEFTLIGDTTNIAARIEQLTKSTGDTILAAEQSVDALTTRPPGLVDRGSHALKGKSAPVHVFGLDAVSVG